MHDAIRLKFRYLAFTEGYDVYGTNDPLHAVHATQHCMVLDVVEMKWLEQEGWGDNESRDISEFPPEWHPDYQEPKAPELPLDNIEELP